MHAKYILGTLIVMRVFINNGLRTIRYYSKCMRIRGFKYNIYGKSLNLHLCIYIHIYTAIANFYILHYVDVLLNIFIILLYVLCFHGYIYINIMNMYTPKQILVI